MEPLTLIFIVALVAIAVLAYFLGQRLATHKAHQHWKAQILLHRSDAIKRSRAVLGGQFSEQLAPFLPDFPYTPTEAKFLGSPIDLLIFKGADNKQIDEVIFLEVKTGKAKLSKQEASLKKAIEQKKVRWEQYTAPEKLTRKKEQ